MTLLAYSNGPVKLDLGVGLEATDGETALEFARSRNKPALLFFTAEW